RGIAQARRRLKLAPRANLGRIGLFSPPTGRSPLEFTKFPVLFPDRRELTAETRRELTAETGSIRNASTTNRSTGSECRADETGSCQMRHKGISGRARELDDAGE